MGPIEIVLLILAIVGDTLAKCLMLPTLLIYFVNWFVVFNEMYPKHPPPRTDLDLLKKDLYIAFFPLTLFPTLGGIFILMKFLDFALKEFVPMDGPLHSAVDKVLKGIAWIFVAVSVYKIYVALPLDNPYSGELANLMYWTIVFLGNIVGAGLLESELESQGRRWQEIPNPNAALLTPPNQGWDPIDASLAILFIVTDVMSNYRVPSMTILMTNFLVKGVVLKTVYTWDEIVTNFMVYFGIGISIYYSWKLILSILTETFFHLAPPGGIHRSTIVQILCTVNGLWFGVTFYKMCIEFEVTSKSLDFDGAMTLAYWGFTSSFLVLKDMNYNPMDRTNLPRYESVDSIDF